MAGIMAGDSKLPGKPALQDMSFFPQREFSEPSGQKADARKPELGSQGKPNKQKEDMQYYFHPRVDLSQVGEGVSRVGVPLEGQLVPMAIPLGKPKTDPALRPPIVTQQPQDTTQEEGNVPLFLTGQNCLPAGNKLFVGVTYKRWIGKRCGFVAAPMRVGWVDILS